MKSRPGHLSKNLPVVSTSFREGNGTPLQHSCLENPMDGGPWWAAVHGVAELDTTERLHFHFSLSCIGEGNGNPFQCSCLENPRDRGAQWPAIYGVAQSWTRLKPLSSSSNSSNTKLEKAMTPHSSTLAWKIPWMQEPGRLQSMGSLSWTRLSDFTFTFTKQLLTNNKG